MNRAGRMLAVIPARGGSKGLPGKNIRSFAGLPLIAHTISFARMCPQIDRCIVSTDAAEIAAVARQHGADVPFLRPAELATDDAPVWPALRHALEQAERDERSTYDFLLLLDPTSPGREPADVAEAVERLQRAPEADGVIAVSRPDFNPAWTCVIQRDGWMADLDAAGAGHERRQEAPVVYRINGALYLWRTAFVRRIHSGWRSSGRHLILEIPESRAMSIDTQEQFERAEALVRAGLVRLPWLAEAGVR